MNTIRNYLEAMFASMPNTPEVLKAKAELLQMMEDKYTELIEDGVAENAAVGTVISEFGNLDELAEELGIGASEPVATGRVLRMDECKGFIKTFSSSALLIALGVFFFITCVCGPIVTDALRFPDWIGVTCMFGFIAVGVVLCVTASVLRGKWKYIRKDDLQLDYATSQYISNENDRHAILKTFAITIGVLLCALSWLPSAIVGSIEVTGFGVVSIAELSAVSLFAMVGIGVFLIIAASSRSKAYSVLLGLNKRGTVSSDYSDQIVYINPTVETVMSVYWSTVTCLYLIISFLTFQWGITWVIWVVAAIAKKIIDINLSVKK